MAVVAFSDTEPLKVLELLSARAVGCSILGTRSRSIQPRTIIAFSFKSLKLVSFSIGMELMLADMVEADVLAEQRTKNILRRTMSSFLMIEEKKLTCKEVRCQYADELDI